MDNNDNSKSIIPSLLSAVLNQSAGPSGLIEITEVEENQAESPSKVNSETQIVNKLISGELTYDEYTQFYGDDSGEEEDEDLDTEIEKPHVQPGAKITRRNRKVSMLPAALQGLMGEANLRWARGENDIAEKICFEIIRQVPNASEPFQTLAQIYETVDPAKSLQYSLIACHLSPKNPEEWLRFAKLSIEKQDYKQAHSCLTKAINADPNNVSYHLMRLELFTDSNLTDTVAYLRAGLRLLKHLSSDQAEMILKYSQEVAEGFFKGGSLNKACEAMEHLFRKGPNLVTVEHVNRMIDVLLGCKSYERVLEILVEFCSFSIEAEKQTYKTQEGTTEENLVVINYLIPLVTPIDIHAKFLICLIHMKLENLSAQILAEAGHFDVELHGDLLFDIAEAFMQENHHLEAFNILDKLVLTEKFSMAAVWLRHAECLQACRKFPEAVESYKQVIALAPQLADVRMTLSTLLREQGRVNEAIVALAQEVSVEELDSDVLIHRCKLLRQHFKFKEYIRDAFLLLSKHCIDESLVPELTLIEAIELPVSKHFRIYPASEVFRKELTKPQKARAKEAHELSIQQDWRIFKDIINIAFLSKEFNLMQRITHAASQSKKFQKDYKKEVEFLNAIACIYTNDAMNGYTILRFMILNDRENVRLWNCFNGLLQTSEDNRVIRFVMRLLPRFDLNCSLNIIQANNSLIAGTYKYAFNKYIETYKKQQTPLLSFLIGVTLFQMSCQKSTAKKHSLVVQGYAFMMQYKKMRGHDCLHEVYYNFGRAFHQLGLFSLAIHYYKKVLRFYTKLLKDNSRNTLDLTREAAFNLSLCYKISGSKNLALLYLRKYIVV